MREGNTIRAGARNNLSAAFELAKVLPEAAFLVSQEGEILAVNPSAARMLGLSEGELRGKLVQDLSADDAGKVEGHLRMWAGSGTPLPGGLQWKGGGGRTVSCRCDGAALRPESREAAAIIFLRCVPKAAASNAFVSLNRELEKLQTEHHKLSRNRDYLEERVAERTAELEAANKELEAFSYSVSHDLRAPLRSMEGFSRILLEDHADELSQEGHEYLQRIASAGQRMGRMIEDLLKLSHASRGQINRQVVDLSALASGIAEELRRRRPERRVEFLIERGVTAEGDRALLEVMLENLLSNAWKFTWGQPDPRIEFGVKQQSPRVFYVRDNGVGFDMAYADKLFRPFQRLHRIDEFEGTGIGLATVQRIINRHGGRIWAEGQVENGAAFYFTL